MVVFGSYLKHALILTNLTTFSRPLSWLTDFYFLQNRVKEAENVQVDIRRKEPQKRIGLSPAKTNVPQTQREGSKFKGMRLAASSKYDFDVTKG